MYLFDDIKNMYTPGKLKKFIDDLHSGKLHRYLSYNKNIIVIFCIEYYYFICREYHYGPDPSENNEIEAKKVTSPPESQFKNLKPNDKRYTILTRDEL